MRAHPFMLFLNPHKDSKIHQLRDAAALSQIMSSHEARGFIRMHDILNSKDANWTGDWFPEDWLVSATRLPVSDLKDEQRKIIQRSGSLIENALLNRALAYFAYLDRGRATLTREMWAALDRRNLADIEFHRYKRNYTLFRDIYAATQSERRPVVNTVAWHSVGYVISDQLWAGGPFMRACFSMDGQTNYGFCALLRTRYPDLLEGLGLSIVEISGMIPPEPQSLRFLDRWETNICLRRVRTTIPPPATMAEACRVPPHFGPDFRDAFEGRWNVAPGIPTAS